MSQQLKKFKQEQVRISNRRLKSNYPKELVIVAEGDSWFDYTLKKDVIDYWIQKTTFGNNAPKAKKVFLPYLLETQDIG